MRRRPQARATTESLSECPARAGRRFEHLDDADVPEPGEESVERDAMEQRIGEPVLLRDVADAGDDRAVGEHDRQRQRQAAQDEQEGQRDDERRQPRAHHQIAVQRAEQHRAGEREHDREPDRPVEIDRRHRDHHAGEADHRADRQVELAGDHQQAGADRDEPQIGRDLRPVHDAVEIEHPRVAGGKPEYDEHQHGAGDRGELRAIEQMPEPRFPAHALVGRRWRWAASAVAGLCVMRIGFPLRP